RHRGAQVFRDPARRVAAAFASAARARGTGALSRTLPAFVDLGVRLFDDRDQLVQLLSLVLRIAAFDRFFDAELEMIGEHDLLDSGEACARGAYLRHHVEAGAA